MSGLHPNNTKNIRKWVGPDLPPEMLVNQILLCCTEIDMLRTQVNTLSSMYRSQIDNSLRNVDSMKMMLKEAMS